MEALLEGAGEECRSSQLRSLQVLAQRTSSMRRLLHGERRAFDLEVGRASGQLLTALHANPQSEGAQCLFFVLE